MPKLFKAEREIEAGPDRVWQLLTDAEGYGEWNRSVVSISGQIADGETIRLVAAVNPKRTFSLKVRDVTPGQRMVWAGGMPLGLFTGVRTFTLRELGGSRTAFSMEETYQGPMAGLISRSIPDLSDSFDEFAACLKAAAEAPAGP